MSSASCRWIGPPPGSPDGGVFHWWAALCLEPGRPAAGTVEVTADARFTLWLEHGDTRQRLGCGPHRGTAAAWCRHRYAVSFPAGPCRLVALVESGTGASGTTPAAQAAVAPGFWLHAPDQPLPPLDTGVADWRVAPAEGLTLRFPRDVPHSRLAGGEQDLDLRRFEDSRDAPRSSWVKAQPATIQPHRTASPTPLPEMLHRSWRGGRVRFVGPADVDPTAERHDAERADAWQAWWSHTQSEITVPANTQTQALVDLEDYLCAYPALAVTGGAHATVEIAWAESLVTHTDTDTPFPPKHHRGDVWNKRFVGRTDTFCGDGRPRIAETFHWRAGRYLRLTVRTADRPLTLGRFTLHETRYPLTWCAAPETGDPELNAAFPLMRRSLETCTHEHFTDCPYYEQLQYLGDTRLQALVAYTSGDDDRLAVRALCLFAAAQRSDGFLPSRLPCTEDQLIPGFCLAWIGMLHDLARWRGHPDLVAELLPAARRVIDAFRQHTDADGLPHQLPGWPFVDWVPAWEDGVPPGARDAPDAIHTFSLVIALRQKAQLEVWTGQPEHARHDTEAAARLAAAARDAFWSDAHQRFADTPHHRTFSDHAQTLAVLANLVSTEEAAALLRRSLDDPAAARTTIYFRHYLLEALAAAGLGDAFHRQLDDWRSLAALGLKTTPEMPEPTRSDNHAWGAHPLYHLPASILGIQPRLPASADAPPVTTVRPLPGPWGRVRADLHHPRGLLRADFTFDPDTHRPTGRLHLDPAIDPDTLDTPPGIERLTIGDTP
ncbi:MAG: alpha-L-rhamnosidase [Planctomycetota bacterium]